MKFNKVKILLVIVCITPLFTSCMVGRFVWYNFSDITDHKIFPARDLPKSTQPFRFIEAQRTDSLGKVSLTILDSLVEANNSVAFLIIRNDSLLFEKYYQGYEANSTVASFSAAKSYTSALIGAALADGYLKSVDEKIITYLPELKDKKDFDKITIKHLLQMTSGIKANESYYNPFGQAAHLYYGRNMRAYIKRLKVDYEPGTQFAYRSINTQLLGLIVERATGKQLTAYLNDRIWSKLGPEYDASWSIDKKDNGLEKTFCCLNAKARDFAKFGRLYLNKGNWNGEQILPASWIETSTRPEKAEGSVYYYRYQWWMTRLGYEASGLHGQYIFVCPEKNLIVVRLGKREGDIPWDAVFDRLAEKL